MHCRGGSCCAGARARRGRSAAAAGRRLPGALVVRAADLRRRLRRIGADAVVQVEIARQDRQQPGVEPVALVAIAPVVLGLQRIGARVAEGERVALVVVVRLVGGERVVRPGTGPGSFAACLISAVTPLKRDLAAALHDGQRARCRWCRRPRPVAHGDPNTASLRLMNRVRWSVLAWVKLRLAARPRDTSRSYAKRRAERCAGSRNSCRTRTRPGWNGPPAGTRDQVAVGGRRAQKASRALLRKSVCPREPSVLRVLARLSPGMRA